MFDAFAICVEDFEPVFVAGAEVIGECFVADRARNDPVCITTFENDNHSRWIIVCAGVWKDEDPFIEHTEHSQDIGDCG